MTNKRIKVLQVSALSKGGAANAAIQLHLSLLQGNIESKILFQEPKPDIPNSYCINSFYKGRPFWKAILFKIHSVLFQIWIMITKRRFENNFGKLQHLNNVYDFSNHPLYNWADIIHMHWVNGFIHWQEVFLTKSKPVVWTVHDMSPFSGGHYYQLDRRTDAYWLLQSQKILQQKKRIIESSLNKIQIISPSHWMMKKAQKSIPFQSLKHFRIKNCVNLQTFKIGNKEKLRSIYGFESHDKVVLFIAYSISDQRKGAHLLQEACKVISSNVKLLVIGNNSSEFEFKQETHFLGQISDQVKLADYYNLADVFICPSLEDNLPYTVAESLCCGTPVVAFNIGGLADMIQHHNNGYLVDQLNGKELAKGIDDLLMHELNSTQIAKDASSQYGYAPIREEHRRIYENLIS